MSFDPGVWSVVDPPISSDRVLHALAQDVADALRERGQMLATAESCTGGWIAKLMTDLAGSSAWFQGGAVTYSNGLKQSLLGVAASTLEQHGAVSRECALEMVRGALERLASDVAVAVTGIAGPTGGTPDKPVGTVWIAWQCRGGDARAELFHFDGDRDAVRRRTVAAALEGIRKSLTA
ncbi:MAG TPA: CinA family protein [Rhodanobacteraceae bacterium]|nr:CinA family protein [Rhodanobacteraceae bacterium]